jgi:hypothetical protein
MYTGVYNGKKKHAEDLLEVLKRGKDMGIHKTILTAGYIYIHIYVYIYSYAHIKCIYIK